MTNIAYYLIFNLVFVKNATKDLQSNKAKVILSPSLVHGSSKIGLFGDVANTFNAIDHQIYLASFIC